MYIELCFCCQKTTCSPHFKRPLAPVTHRNSSAPTSSIIIPLQNSLSPAHLSPPSPSTELLAPAPTNKF